MSTWLRELGGMDEGAAQRAARVSPIVSDCDDCIAARAQPLPLSSRPTRPAYQPFAIVPRAITAALRPVSPPASPPSPSLAIRAQAEHERAQAEQEQARAEQERARAEAVRARTEAERMFADAPIDSWADHVEDVEAATSSMLASWANLAALNVDYGATIDVQRPRATPRRPWRVSNGVPCPNCQGTHRLRECTAPMHMARDGPPASPAWRNMVVGRHSRPPLALSTHEEENGDENVEGEDSSSA